MSAEPSNGTLGAGKSQIITVKYDVSQNEFQGMYEADILITTTGQPLAKASYSTSCNCCLSLLKNVNEYHPCLCSREAFAMVRRDMHHQVLE